MSDEVNVPTFSRFELDQEIADARDKDDEEGTQTAVMFYASCHEEAGLAVAYAEGKVYFACHQCGEAICTVAVAEVKPLTEVN